jgi:hypothetical protein
MGDDALTEGEGQGTIRLDDPFLTGGAGLLDSSSGTLAGLPFFAPSAIGRSLG